MNDALARLRRRLEDGLAPLPDKPEESTESAWRALCQMAAGRRLSATAAMQEAPVPTGDDAFLATLEALVARRLDGEPLAHITGRQHFMDLEMLSGPQALIPRAETEMLARCAIELLQRDPATRQARVIDVCTGSGNLALAIAHYAPDAQVFGADISADAVALACKNAAHLGLQDRVGFRCGDLLAPFDDAGFHGSVDLVVCNPPYISSAKVPAMPAETSRHEPAAAFDGGPLGISILMRLLDAAPRFLRSGGYLAFEVGAGQGPAIARRLQSRVEYQDVHAIEDATGVIRVLAVGRA